MLQKRGHESSDWIRVIGNVKVLVLQVADFEFRSRKELEVRVNVRETGTADAETGANGNGCYDSGADDREDGGTVKSHREEEAEALFDLHGEVAKE